MNCSMNTTLTIPPIFNYCLPIKKLLHINIIWLLQKKKLKSEKKEAQRSATYYKQLLNACSMSFSEVSHKNSGLRVGKMKK